MLCGAARGKGDLSDDRAAMGGDASSAPRYLYF